MAFRVVAPGLAFALLGFCHGEDPPGLRFSRRVRSIPAGIWIGNEASHHCNTLDEFGNALPEQKHEADEDERFGRPLRHAARIHRLFVELKRSDEKRNRCDDHDDGHRQQEEYVTEDVDAVTPPLWQHAVTRISQHKTLPKIVSEWRDEAEPAAGLGNLDVACRPAAAIVDLLELEA